MSEKISAPWTDDEVVALNAYQRSRFYSSFVCLDTDRSELVATTDGWICRKCGYTQDWALTKMVTLGAFYLEVVTPTW